MTGKREIFPVVKTWDENKKKWTKKPAIHGSWQGYEATEEEQSRAKNLGLGIPKGRVVIDVDTYKGATTEAIDAALGVALDWEGAALQRTVSGGMHYCFLLGEGVEVRQGDSLLGVRGFDTRCSGKGWMCSGEGYEDLTVVGVLDALWEWSFPTLPQEAITALTSGASVISRESEKTSVNRVGPSVLDLDIAVAQQPLDDVGIEDILEYLRRLPDDYLAGYDNWLKVGMAIHHQTGGSIEGRDAWTEWSRGCDERELHNAEGVRVAFDEREIKTKWQSFGRRVTGKPVRFSYVIKAAGGRIRESTVVGDKSLLDTLVAEAASVVDVDGWQALKERVGRLGLNQLPSDHRAIVAKAVADGWGKLAGVGKVEIKGALKAGRVKRGAGGDEGGGHQPAWLSDWVYVESACQFYNTRLGYGIKREAFNAKYDREQECLIAEKRASDLALVDYRMDTVVDTFFFPNATQRFEHDGKAMVNAYRDRRVAACDAWDDEAKATVDAFERHLELLFSDERERRLAVDWMSYVVRNPGKRVNWALVIQGAQGIGKSFLTVALQAVMGENVKNLDPTAISGRFTGWAHGALVNAVEELRISGTSKWEILDRLKPFITNQTVQIEEKGRDHRTVPNFTSYIFFTNYKDALPITEDDRRYCLLFSDIQSEEDLLGRLGGRKKADEYFSRLFELTNRRPDALRRFFDEWEYSEEFSASGRAPTTRHKTMIRELSVSEDQMIIEDAISRHECDVIGPQVLDMTWLNRLCAAEGVELPKTRAVGNVLLRMGYVPVEGRKVRLRGARLEHYVWRRAAYHEDEARRLVRDFHAPEDDGVPF